MLIVILIYNNVTSHGGPLTTWLCCAGINGHLPVLIRGPKLLFKPNGFFFANAWIKYNRIRRDKLSEDGVLVMQLNNAAFLSASKILTTWRKSISFSYQVMLPTY
ncbi:DUF986 family protein [Shigella flexneri]